MAILSMRGSAGFRIDSRVEALGCKLEVATVVRLAFRLVLITRRHFFPSFLLRQRVSHQIPPTSSFYLTATDADPGFSVMIKREHTTSTTAGTGVWVLLTLNYLTADDMGENEQRS